MAFLWFKKKKSEDLKEDKVELNRKDLENHGKYRHRYGPETIMTAMKHWKNIEIHPEFFPDIDESKKPDNPDFIKIKLQYAEMVFKVIEDYYLYTINLSGLSNRPDLHIILKHTLLDFIILFWDMPSSKSNHHSYRFGHLLHSLRVACENAEEGESFKLYTESGINTESMIRDKGHIVLAHFFIGLFHDAHKIHDYQLTHQTPYRKVEWNPHLGSVLNFKLVHPKNLYEDWEKLPQDTSHYSIAYMWWLVPPEFFSSIESSELHRYIMDQMRKFIDGGIAGDHEDATLGLREDPQQKMYLGLTSAMIELLEDSHAKDHIYRVSDDWCCVMFKSFMPNVARRSVVFPNDAAVINYMNHLGVVAAPYSEGVPKYSERYNFVLASGDSKGKRVKKAGLTFIESEFVETLLLEVARKHNSHPELTQIQIETDVFSKESLIKGLIPSLPEECFCLSPEAVAAANQSKSQESGEVGQSAEDLNQSEETNQTRGTVMDSNESQPPISSDQISEEELMAHSASYISDEEPPYDENEYLPPNEELTPQGTDLDPELEKLATMDISTVRVAQEPPEKNNSEEEKLAEPLLTSSKGTVDEEDVPDRIVSEHGEEFDADTFVNRIIETLNQGGLNDSKSPLALYVTNGDVGAGRLYLKVPDLFEKILHMENMLQTEEGHAALMKTLAVLEKNGLITPLTDGMPQRLNEVTYFSVDDMVEESPLAIRDFLAVEFSEMRTAKGSINDLKKYIEWHDLEVVEE